MAPAEPQRTSSSAGGSLTMVRRKSEAAATSWGDLASLAPAATSSSAREAVRFQTVSGWPALMRFIPMGRPMRSSPIRPMCFAGEFKSDLLDEEWIHKPAFCRINEHYCTDFGRGEASERG